MSLDAVESGGQAMLTKTSSSDVCAPNLSGDSITDEDLIRAFILALAASGRKPKTLTVYQESVRPLSVFARDLGLPGIETNACGLRSP